MSTELDLALALAKVKATGKGMSTRALAKLLNVPVATVARDVGEGRQARQVNGANRYPARVRQAVNGALRTLARLEALTYFTDEQLAEYFASLNVKADRLRFLGTLLEGIGESMAKREQAPQERKCAECDAPLATYRADARYCEKARCRQAAYRKRKAALRPMRPVRRRKHNELPNVTPVSSPRAAQP